MRRTFEREFNTVSHTLYSIGRKFEAAACDARSATYNIGEAASTRRPALKRWVLILSITLMLVAGVSSSQEQSGSGYALMWSAINGGGTTLSTGGTYSLGGTIGQPGAGSMIGGSYTVAGGFWSGIPAVYRVFLPPILK